MISRVMLSEIWHRWDLYTNAGKWLLHKLVHVGVTMADAYEAME